MNKLNLSISSKIKNIAKVENFIEYITEFFDLKPKLIGEITLPIIEAVNNAILFGNKLSPRKKVNLDAWKNDGKFFISVQDEGNGFDYAEIPNPTLPCNIEKVAGRGLYVMKALSDELFFENKGAKVTMVFNL